MKTRKTYLIEVIEEDNKIAIKRVADNLTAIEILGLLYHAQFDIMEQMKGIMPQPEIVERKVIVRK